MPTFPHAMAHGPAKETPRAKAILRALNPFTGIYAPRLAEAESSRGSSCRERDGEAGNHPADEAL